MSLPEGFQFSQSALQDYVDCERRFELRYLLRRAWPAVESEPYLENERYMQDGAQFHRMVQQYLLGVPAERISSMKLSEELRAWWENFLDFRETNLPLPDDGSENSRQIYPEMSLSAPFPDPQGDYRTVAKYDLVLLNASGRVVIYDWKTSRTRTRSSYLKQRLQTRIYPYLFVQAGETLVPNINTQPENIEMIYWFANSPNRPERIAYNRGQYEADKTYLEGLLESILARSDGQFALTENVRHCNYCVYRSLCKRGVSAGTLEDDAAMDTGSEIDLELDFEQIAEIEY